MITPQIAATKVRNIPVTGLHSSTMSKSKSTQTLILIKTILVTMSIIITIVMSSIETLTIAIP